MILSPFNFTDSDRSLYLTEMMAVVERATFHGYPRQVFDGDPDDDLSFYTWQQTREDIRARMVDAGFAPIVVKALMGE